MEQRLELRERSLVLQSQSRRTVGWVGFFGGWFGVCFSWGGGQSEPRRAAALFKQKLKRMSRKLEKQVKHMEM